MASITQCILPTHFDYTDQARHAEGHPSAELCPGNTAVKQHSQKLQLEMNQEYYLWCSDLVYLCLFYWTSCNSVSIFMGLDEILLISHGKT